MLDLCVCEEEKVHACIALHGASSGSQSVKLKRQQLNIVTTDTKLTGAQLLVQPIHYFHILLTNLDASHVAIPSDPLLVDAFG